MPEEKITRRSAIIRSVLAAASGGVASLFGRFGKTEPQPPVMSNDVYRASSLDGLDPVPIEFDLELITIPLLHGTSIL